MHTANDLAKRLTECLGQRPTKSESGLQYEHLYAIRSFDMAGVEWNDQQMAKTTARPKANDPGPNASYACSHPLLLFGIHRVGLLISSSPTSLTCLLLLRPRPLDWPNWVQITGSWVLPQSESSWEPPKDLEEFMRKAREDGKPLVYCGFGSITVKDPVGLTTAIFESAKAADVRMILSKGKYRRLVLSNATKVLN